MVSGGLIIGVRERKNKFTTSTDTLNVSLDFKFMCNLTNISVENPYNIATSFYLAYIYVRVNTLGSLFLNSKLRYDI